MKTIRICLAGLLSFFLINECLGSDPVAWALFPATGFPAVKVGDSASVTYTLTNRLPFAARINTSFLNIGGLFNAQDQCNNVSLAPNTSCNIAITFSPQSPGVSSIQLIYGYHNNRIPLPVLTATGTPNGGGSCVAVAAVTIPFLSNTFIYADNLIQYTFRNDCTDKPATLGKISINTTVNGLEQGATTTIGNDHCSGATLSPGGKCTVLASVIALTSGIINSTASTQSGGSTVSAATTSAVMPNNYQHSVMFINQCPFPVWYGVANDGPNKADPTNPAGPDDYLLPAQQPGMPSSTKTVIFNNPTEDYLGIFFPRTGCQTVMGQLVCETGQCMPDAPPNGGRCALGQEPAPPYTKMEVNFFALARPDGSYDGVYDISLIEGFNIPVEMKALGPGATIIPYPPANNTAFQCTGAGAPIQAANPPTPEFPLGSCSWIVTPPSSDNMQPRFFNFVTEGDIAAGQNNCSCTAQNPVCGMAFKTTDPHKGNLIMSCGQLLGTWALKTLCTQPYADAPDANNPYKYYKCGEFINVQSGTQHGYPPNTTLSDLYGCVTPDPALPPLNSCFRSDATSYCCGAVNWNENPYLNAQDQQFITQNPDWGGPISSSTISPSPYQSILWYKTACPTAYSYPYDDHSSSFYCKEASPGQKVKMNYQVVFCPGGLTGRP